MAEQEGRKKGFKSSIKGTFGRLFARTDIPIKVKQNAGQTVKTKNIVYVSGSKTWKAKADTAAMLNNGGNNGVQASNPTGISLDFHVTPSDLGSSFGSAQTTQRSGMIENDTYETSGSKTMMVQNGGMRMDGNSSYQHNLQNVGQGGIGSQGQVHNTSYTTQPQVGVGNYYGQQNTGFQNTANQPSTSFTNIPATADGAQSKMAPAGSGQVSPRDRKFERRESERLWNPPTKDKNTYRHQYFIQKQRNLEDDDEVLELMNREPSPVRVDPAALGQGSPPRLQGRHSPPRRQQSRGPVLANITPAFQNQLSGLLGGQHGTGEVNNNNTTLDVNRNGVQGNTQINMNGRSAGAIPLPPPISTIPSVQHGIAMGVSSSGGGMPPPPPPPPHLPQGWITTHPPAPNTGSNPGQNHTIPPSSSSESSEEEDDDEDSDLERKPSLVQRRDVETNTTGTISGTAAMQLRVNGPLDGQVLNIPTPQTTISVPQLSPGSVASNSSTIRMFMQSSPTSIYNPASAATPTYSNASGSPLSVDVSDPRKRMSISRNSQRQGTVGRSTHSFIETRGLHVQRELVTVHIRAPNGDKVPANIIQQPDGDFKVEYSSKYTGRHTVEILYAGQAIMGSPFYVEIYDPNKIKVLGTPNSIVGQKVEFEIVSHEAGKAELGLNILSPSGKKVPYDTMPTSLGEKVTYLPTEPGPHNIYITYGGLEVPGNPITQNIVDSGSGVTVYGEGLSRAEVGKHARFYVDSKGHRGEITRHQVDGPNSYAKCQIEPDGAGRYIFSYVPLEVGDFSVRLEWNHRELSGCPYRVKVVDPAAVGLIGGWEQHLDAQRHLSLQVNQTKQLEFDVSRAGPGRLSAEVEGPNGALVPTYVERRGNGTEVISFTPFQEGMHHVKIHWGEFALAHLPFSGLANASSRVSHEKVVLTGRGLKEARVKEEAEFVIDGTEAGQGEPHVTLSGVKADVPVRLHSLGSNRYRASYVANMAGAYLLNIQWSDRQVKGSPFKVNVVSVGDAAKVRTSGEGLQMGIMGREIKATIDTRHAGPGELTAQCEGPTKIAYCTLIDHRDGTFTLSVKPQEPGKHILQIKYDGEHVQGSPYTLKISGAPDASKVVVRGPGIENGILAIYQSAFICETKGAGAGQLTVRIRGPKAAFRVEMQRDSQKDRTIKCKYDPTEVGEYIVAVRWSDEHVPGSPFKVHIFDTKDQLDRFNMENPTLMRRTTGPNAVSGSQFAGWHDTF